MGQADHPLARADEPAQARLEPISRRAEGRLSSSSPRRGFHVAWTPAPVAQRIEHLTTDQKVGVSNTSGRATRFDGHRKRLSLGAAMTCACRRWCRAWRARLPHAVEHHSRRGCRLTKYSTQPGARQASSEPSDSAARSATVDRASSATKTDPAWASETRVSRRSPCLRPHQGRPGRRGCGVLVHGDEGCGGLDRNLAGWTVVVGEACRESARRVSQASQVSVCPRQVALRCRLQPGRQVVGPLVVPGGRRSQPGDRLLCGRQGVVHVPALGPDGVHQLDREGLAEQWCGRRRRAHVDQTNGWSPDYPFDLWDVARHHD